MQRSLQLTQPPTEAADSPRRRVATAKLTFSSALKPRAAKMGGYVRFDHVIVGGVEDVAPDDPHDALVHHRLVGSSGQAGICVLLPAPEGGVGRNRDGAVGTCRGRKEASFKQLVSISNRKSTSRARDRKEGARFPQAASFTGRNPPLMFREPAQRACDISWRGSRAAPVWRPLTADREHAASIKTWRRARTNGASKRPIWFLLQGPSCSRPPWRPWRAAVCLRAQSG